MTTVGIVPARMGSTRFPNKPLADICGLPMAVHCCLRAQRASTVDEVYVATCDDEIAEVSRDHDIPVVMTSADHLNAVTRTAEAAAILEGDGKLNDESLVVMVQGDEPLLNPRALDLLVEALANSPEAGITNIMLPFTSEVDFADENNVKVVTNLKDHAIYMSREAIPTRWRGWHEQRSWMQTGLMCFRTQALEWFARTPRAPLEAIESIDMLRVIEHGGIVQMVRFDEFALGVDTPEDLEEVRRLMPGDALFTTYGGRPRPLASLT